MNHRVFIAINLAPEIREKLYSTRDQYSQLPCRWTKKENLHLTLLFLGYLNDEEVLQTCQTVQEIGKKHPSFDLELNRIIFAPPGKKIPRMIWVQGQPSKELAALRNDLENSFFDKMSHPPGASEMTNQPNEDEKHGFSPHTTLGRLKQWQFQQMEPEEIPEINNKISLTVPVESIEVMESELKREGPEYAILESIPLG